MKLFLRTRRLALMLFSLLWLGEGTVPAVGIITSPVTPALTSELPDFHAIAATPQRIQRMGKSDLLGHIWVADFFFTSCGSLCPRMTRQMRQLQNRLSPDVLLVSFTIDPDKDSPKTLQSYARDIDADPKRWFFLHMNKKPLLQLMSSGFKMITVKPEAAKPAAENAAPAHSSRFVLIDARGRVRAYYDGLNQDSLDVVVAAANVLEKETSASSQGGR